jgi:hypothetical protein
MKRYAFLLLLTAAFAAASCGGSQKSSPTPTAPSSQTAMVTSPGSVTTTIDLSVTTPTGLDTVSTGAGVARPIVGVVERLEGVCPALSFKLAGITVLVSDKTTYESGTCADLENGIRVGVLGVKKDDNTIQAARVKIAPPLSPLPPPVIGQVGSVSGTCPALTFVLGDTTVRTTDKTDFDGGVCADVKTGVRAGAQGPRGADGVLTAAHVRIGLPPLETVHGIVSALGGDCPRMSFALLEPGSRTGVTVMTSGKTRFEGGVCGDLRNGFRAGAVGPKSATGAIEALGVKMAK